MYIYCLLPIPYSSGQKLTKVKKSGQCSMQKPQEAVKRARQWSKLIWFTSTINRQPI